MVPTPPSAPAAPRPRDRRGFVYEPAIGPRLKVLLVVTFVGVALLGATGVYLFAVRALEWARGALYTNQFTLGMFIAHVAVGVALTVPFLVFGIAHWTGARKRPNRVAVRLGIALFLVGIVVGVTGLALIQLEGMPQLPTNSAARWVVYALHALAPFPAVVLYVQHRRAGPRVQWRWGYAWGGSVGVFVAAMAVLHSYDPRSQNPGPRDGRDYFEPSLIRTPNNTFIPAASLMMDEYCLKCHADVYDQHFHSAHKFSSFNNPPYRFSVRQTREFGLKRDGNTKASRWCAGCHDVVPFVSGEFDDPRYDDVNNPTAHAGITCTVCHAVTHVNSTAGNADYTLEEPQHYPFAYSRSPFLQWVNNQVVKAKPDFHKKTFLKPLHRSAEFCSTCHKVGLPPQLNHYKEFLRGQNHYDTYLLSGVSGVGVRSFYYPPVAKTTCAECHMPGVASADFGARDFDGSGTRKVHHHGFPGANTGLMAILALDPSKAEHADRFRQMARAHADFLRGTDPEGKDKKLRIDLFGLKEGGATDGKLIAPLRPELPRLKPGATYLVEVVIRTLNVGHPFSQGTVDSNEIWVDFEARSGDRVIGRSGGMTGPKDAGAVDEWAHFVNVLMLDRNGNRIDRRNPQDIFTPLYDHQIPPGSAQVVHYKLAVPADVQAPVELKARLRYRKFDAAYMRHVYGSEDKVPKLPVVDVCEDAVTLPVEGVAAGVSAQASPVKPAWQRWNDYGIGSLLEGGAGLKKGDLRQAEEAFRQLLTLDPEAHAHGYLNLGRVYVEEGRLDEAARVLNQAAEAKAPWWTVAWFTGLVNVRNGHLDDARKNFEQILDPANQPRERKFDFRRDFIVINELGNTLFNLAKQEVDDAAARERLLRGAVAQFEKTLTLDGEDLTAHYQLSQCFKLLGGAAPQRDNAAARPAPTDARLRQLAESFATPGPTAERLQVAAQLGEDLQAFAAAPADYARPRLPTWQALIRTLRPILDRPTDAEVHPAAAALLGQLYRQTHLVYKPDENAKDHTVRLYREKHPAAAAASQAIVIYPTDRFTAPAP